MNKDTKNKNSKQKLKTSFTGGNLTNYSGLSPIIDFMEKIGIEKDFNNLPIHMHHNAQFSTSDILSSILIGIMSGQDSLAKIENFTNDPLVQQRLGLHKNISDATLSGRLKMFNMPLNNQLMQINADLSNKVSKKTGVKEDIIDIDSTVKTVYGNQEGAEEGYNDKKKGAKSYHPIMAFKNSTRECILSWLRPGNSHTANNSVGFIKQLMSMLSPKIRQKLIRADSGFFSESIIECIESYKNTDYLIKVKLKNLREVLSEQNWEKVPGMSGIEICDFEYQPGSWKKSRHFYAVRKLQKVETEGLLFPKQEYQHFCYCTNIVDNPLQIHRLYGDRATSENWIEHVKNQMFGGKILTSEFWANEALWQMSVMAYNTLIWMRKLTDRDSWREEPRTFRTWFIQLAGKLVRSGRQIYLKMYESYYYQDRWKKIESAIGQLSFA